MRSASVPSPTARARGRRTVRGRFYAARAGDREATQIDRNIRSGNVYSVRILVRHDEIASEQITSARLAVDRDRIARAVPGKAARLDRAGVIDLGHAIRRVGGWGSGQSQTEREGKDGSEREAVREERSGVCQIRHALVPLVERWQVF